MHGLAGWLLLAGWLAPADLLMRDCAVLTPATTAKQHRNNG